MQWREILEQSGTVRLVHPSGKKWHDRGVDWVGLGQAVVNRRVELGFARRQALATAAPMSERILSDIEKARRTSYDPATFARLEQALLWPPGTVTRILKGEPGADGWSVQVQGDSPASTLDTLAALLSDDSPLTPAIRGTLATGLKQLARRLTDTTASVADVNRALNDVTRETVGDPRRIEPPTSGRFLDALLNPATQMADEDREAIRKLVQAALQLGETAMMAHDAKYGLNIAEAVAIARMAESGVHVRFYEENDRIPAAGRPASHPG